MSELVNELYVSKSTIYKDITSLNEFFSSYKINMYINKEKIRIEGKERHIRDCIFDLLRKDEKTEELIFDDKYECKDVFIYKALDYTDRNIKDIFNTILESKLPIFDELSFRSLQVILLRFFISTIRVMDEHYVTLSKEFRDKLLDSGFYSEIVTICKLLEDKYLIIFNEEEINYLQVHIQSIVTDKKLFKKTLKAEMFVNLLINGWMKEIDYPLDSDPELFDGLLKHVKPLITRLEENISISNHLLPLIKSQFKYTFLITENSCKYIEEITKFNISDEEIGFLTLYFVSALDRVKEKVNTLLVSENGDGLCILLEERINKLVPYLNIDNFVNVSSINSSDISKYDLILSTKTINTDENKPLCIISPILNESDILKLNEIGYSLYKEKNDPAKRYRGSLEII